MQKRHISPFLFPAAFFLAAIFIGTFLLRLPGATRFGISFVDALFTATSATCVTGLTVVDTGTCFTYFGQTVILVLIQIGGLGIMSITSLFFYLWRKRVSLTDRVAVGQSLLHDPAFHLGRFLVLMCFYTLVIEGAGAILLYFLCTGSGISFFSAVFHAISAFCNAGFSLYADSLSRWRGNIAVCLIFCFLIILGGLGFSVLVEISEFINSRFFKRVSGKDEPFMLSWYATVVIKTSLFLIVFGAIAIYLGEFVAFDRRLSMKEAVIASLFQSVTCRTAGFNTVPVGALSNVTLLVMIILMFIGGAPGSCAGGVKVTTFRTLIAFAGSNIRGWPQVVVGKFAAGRETLNKAFSLLVFAVLVILAGILALNITEGGMAPHPQTRGLFLDIVFEVVSAFGTVGLSTGLTPHLSSFGKVVIAVVMFVGRLGPILFLSIIRSFQQVPVYRWPEEEMLIG